MKNTKDIKNKNGFLVTCISCIVILLIMCYFGINATIKGTAAANSTGYYCYSGYNLTTFNGEHACLMEGATVKATEDGGACQISTTDGSWANSLEFDDGYSCEVKATEDGFSYLCSKSFTSINDSDDCITAALNDSTYTIYYDVGAGTGGPQDSVKYHDQPYTISSLQPTPPSGKNFVGWTGSDGKTYQPGDKYTTNAMLMLTAKYEDNKVTGTISLSPKSATYTGSAIAANTATTNSGGTVSYVYYTDSSCTTKTTNSAGASANGGAPVDAGTYYVKASVAASGNYTSASTGCISHTINQKNVAVSWGGTTSFTYTGSALGPTASASTGISGETIVLRRTAAIAVGSHTSTAGCDRVSGGRGKCSNYTLSNTTKSFTIYEDTTPATPTETTLTATFNKNGGTLNGSGTLSCKTTTGSCNVSGLPTATKSGYNFKGWGTSSSCTSGSTGSITLTSNKTYYACYEKIEESTPTTPTEKTLTATFNPNTGTLNGSNKLSCKTTTGSCNVSKLPTATKGGYTFKGWGTSSSCTSGSTGSITLTSDTTYYACFAKNSNTNTTDEDGNTKENPKTGEIAIALTWFLGLVAIGYSFYYFRNVKEN